MKEQSQIKLSEMKVDLTGLSILLIDHGGQMIRQVRQGFTELGARVHLTGDFVTARTLVAGDQPGVILVDVDSTEADSFEDFKRLQAAAGSSQIFLLSESTEGLDAKTLEVAGVIRKPLDIPKFSLELAKVLFAAKAPIKALDPTTSLLRPYLVYRSPAMKHALRFLPQIAQSPHNVLITGETGTGKEVIAHTLHEISPRKSGPFVAVNCGAIPESLIEGELFGHEKGAFTGATATRRGKFELAEGGTLFLDEMGEMPLALQARLLRVLEERMFYRVGGEKPVKVDVRVIAATQVDLEKAVSNGLFREDLLFRLNLFQVHLPPLRERPEDVPLLAWHFLERAFVEVNRPKPYPALEEEAIALLAKLPWSGNVRELRNLITRLAVLLPLEAESITAETLMEYFPGGKTLFAREEPSVGEETWSLEGRRFRSIPPEEGEVGPQVIEMTTHSKEGIFIPREATLAEAEEILIQEAMKDTKGNKSRAAKKLGIGLRTIRRKLNEA